MRFFVGTNYNFVRFGRVAFVFSLTLMAITTASLLIKGGPNLSVDFAGGMRVNVKFLERISTDQLATVRSRLDVDEVHTVGLNEDELVIQQKGAELARELTSIVIQARKEKGSFDSIEEVLALEGMEQVSEQSIRNTFTTAEVGEEKVSGAETGGEVTHKANINAISESGLLERMQEVVVRDMTAHIEEILEELFPSEGYAPGKFDLNRMEQLETLEMSFTEVLGDEARALEIAEAIFHYRHLDDPIAVISLVPSFDELADFADLSDEELSKIRDSFFIRPFEIRGSEIVGPRVSGEIAQKALYGLLLAFVLMLIYIAFRFDLRSGVMAIIALLHDVYIVLGLCSVLNIEVSMTVIAGFLTAVGYSINDTVVYYDRIREGLSQRRKETYAESLNRAINENLSRTILTGVSALLVLGVLLFVGGQALRDFAVVMIAGIFLGTYSSIYVTAPLLIEWNNWSSKRGKGVSRKKIGRSRKRR